MMPAHVPTVDGARLRLRPWRMTDVAAVQAGADDPHIPQITSVPASGRRVDAEAFVERQWTRLPSGEGYAFAVALRATDEAVGHLGVWTKAVNNGRVTLGYWIAPAHRRRGYVTEAVSLATEWALTHDEVHRVELFVEPWNEGSWRAAEACGFEREGLLRNWEAIGGEPKNLFSYSRVRPS